ncbi:hypothetical protein [Sphingobium bisphenolivorans]|uniref:hypothetical protein n=1 Tax=Sphingobium bisphenolivorans TaxID=1335760 RepID=UPI001269B57B|nr:hypothetical protein [Sphingobium bisphenolivorans]
MPHFTDGATAPSYRIFALVLAELQASSWQPLAQAAATVRRAVPHLSQPITPDPAEATGSGEEDGLVAALESAGMLCEIAFGEEADQHPIDRLCQLVERAAATRAFFPRQREHQLISTPLGSKAVEVRPVRPPFWALDLHLGAALSRLGLMPFALPLPGATSQEALDSRGHRQQREHAWFGSLTQALRNVQCAFEGALADQKPLEACRSQLRSSSRAPLVYALITALGACRTKDLQQALGASRLGVRGMLESLVTAGLVIRGDRGAWVRANGSAVAGDGASPVAPLPSVNARRIDEDLADLDRILSRLS